MAIGSPVVVGVGSSAVIGAVLSLLQSCFADHDSWDVALAWAAIWVAVMFAVLLTYEVWRSRRDDQAAGLEHAARPQP